MLEAAMLGSATALLGVLGPLSAARIWHTQPRRTARSFGVLLTRCATTYLQGHADERRERARCATLVAVTATLPPGGLLSDRRADGATITIHRPTQQRSPQERPQRRCPSPTLPASPCAAGCAVHSDAATGETRQ